MEQLLRIKRMGRQLHREFYKLKRIATQATKGVAGPFRSLPLNTLYNLALQHMPKDEMQDIFNELKKHQEALTKFRKSASLRRPEDDEDHEDEKLLQLEAMGDDQLHERFHRLKQKILARRQDL
eukprot:m.89842 g.89842  ORF g.89842 m.89842 type:complete len:124 (+) comp21548_c0_seq2:384-755(+)